MVINVPFVARYIYEDEIDFPLHLLAGYLRKSGEKTRGRTGAPAPVLSVPDRIGDGDDERMDILNADTALSERPHRHDIKTLK